MLVPVFFMGNTGDFISYDWGSLCITAISNSIFLVELNMVYSKFSNHTFNLITIAYISSTLQSRASLHIDYIKQDEEFHYIGCYSKSFKIKWSYITLHGTPLHYYSYVISALSS